MRTPTSCAGSSSRSPAATARSSTSAPRACVTARPARTRRTFPSWGCSSTAPRSTRSRRRSTSPRRGSPPAAGRCSPRWRGLSLPRPDAVPAQLLHLVEVLLDDALPGDARALEDPRQAVEAGLGDEHRAALRAELARAERGVAVDVGAQPGLGVVDVQRAEPITADDAVDLVDDVRQRLARAHVVAAREEVAGDQAHGDPV